MNLYTVPPFVQEKHTLEASNVDSVIHEWLRMPILIQSLQVPNAELVGTLSLPTIYRITRSS